jgi:ABC-2 type transport system ATP-binding protein
MSVEGVTVVLSTHVLPQVDELCSHICLINRARPILVGALAEIRERFGGNAWTVRSDLDQDGLAALPGVTAVSPLKNDSLLELADGASPRELIHALVESGELESFTRFVPDLENIFLRAVGEDSHAA